MLYLYIFRNHNQRLLLPLYPMHLEEGTGDRTSNPLQDQRRHQQTSQTCSSASPTTNAEHRRRMATRTRGDRQFGHKHQHTQLHRLRNRTLGREQPRPMEPPQYRRTQDYQPRGRLAPQVEEPRAAPTPKHLQPHQTDPEPAVSYRNPTHPVRSRR